MKKKPRLSVGLVHTAAGINCIFGILVVSYGIHTLKGYVAEQRVQRKHQEEWKRNQQPISRVLNSSAGSGSLIMMPSVSSFIVGTSSGPNLPHNDAVELKTDEELKVFNQWFYSTGANGVPYWSHNVKNNLPNADGNYDKHFEVSMNEYVWMMQWKFRKQWDAK